MAIALPSQTNTTYANRTNTPLTLPSGVQAGDILKVTIFCGRAGATPFTPTNANYTTWGTPTNISDGSFQGNTNIFWRRATASESDPTFNHSAQSTQGLIQRLTGCIASGTPFGATSNNTANTPGGITATGTSITTSVANAWLCFDAIDWSAPQNLTPPTGMTEQLDSTIYSATELIAVAGATGSRVLTLTGITDPWSVRMTELLPASTVTMPPRPRIQRPYMKALLAR